MTPMLNRMRRQHEQCRQVREQMSDYLDGELDPTAVAAVTRHTRLCPNCQRMLANLARTVAGLRALRDLPALPDEPPGRD